MDYQDCVSNTKRARAKRGDGLSSINIDEYLNSIDQKCKMSHSGAASADNTEKKNKKESEKKKLK